MKNVFTSVFLLLSLCFFAQAPQKISYQAVIRNSGGQLISSSPVGVKISILKDSETGAVVYEETHTTTTNVNGLASIDIGGGTPINGTFSTINWASGNYFIKTETDVTGGTNYDVVSIGQMLSVPYALYAQNSPNLGKSTIYLTDDITDAEAAAQIEEEAGVNTENVIIEGTTLLTTIDLSKVKSLLTLRIRGNQALASVNLSQLKRVYKELDVSNNPLITALNFSAFEKSNAGLFYINFNEALNSLQFPVLTSALSANIENNINLSTLNFNALTKNSNGGIRIQNNNLSTLAFPSLIETSLIISDAHLASIDLPILTTGYIELTGPLTTLNAPNLTNCGISITNSQLTSLNFQNLVSPGFGSIDLINNTALTEVAFPALTNVLSYFNIHSNTQLNTISIPTLSVLNPENSNYSFYFKVSGNALPSSQINYLLNKLTTLNPNPGKTIDLSNQNPPAPPTDQGVLDVQTLISNGFEVLTD